MYEITDWTIQKQLCYKYTKRLYLSNWDKLALSIMLCKYMNFMFSLRGNGKKEALKKWHKQ